MHHMHACTRSGRVGLLVLTLRRLSHGSTDRAVQCRSIIGPIERWVRCMSPREVHASADHTSMARLCTRTPDRLHSTTTNFGLPLLVHAAHACMAATPSVWRVRSNVPGRRQASSEQALLGTSQGLRQASEYIRREGGIEGTFASLARVHRKSRGQCLISSMFHIRACKVFALQEPI